jgi:prepilin peptidase CpaA
MLATLALGIYVAALAAAGLSDLVRYEIPNALGLALVGGFFLMTPALPLGIALGHAAIGLAVLAVAALCFAFGVMGGGDAKLLAATALWMGWRNLLPFCLLTALLGAVISLILLLLRRVVPAPAETGHWYSRVLSREAGVPYGLAISGAGLALVGSLGVAEM